MVQKNVTAFIPLSLIIKFILNLQVIFFSIFLYILILKI